MSCKDGIISMIDRLIYHQDLLVSQNDGFSNVNVTHSNMLSVSVHTDCQNILIDDSCKSDNRSTSADKKK